LSHFIEQFDYLTHTINDLILLSKFDSARTELTQSPVRLDLLIADICSLFQVLAEQKGLSLEADTGDEITIAGDKTRLQQLFTNLIDNAIKYTPAGKIRIGMEIHPDSVSVRIMDTGIGIPRTELQNIFKRFYRVDKSRSKETGGVGLGLSIAEWIVHNHRGRIEVESELNQGSTFTVSFPLSEA
jgi:signal transduction histidine kinase